MAERFDFRLSRPSKKKKHDVRCLLQELSDAGLRKTAWTCLLTGSEGALFFFDIKCS